MVADEFLEKGIPKKPIFKVLDLPRSSYYYVSKGTKAGKQPLKYVLTKQGIKVPICEVVNSIKTLLGGEFVDYGYYKTYRYLTDELGYRIGSTRTYNLMKAAQLLKFQRSNIKRLNRNWVKELVPKVDTEFSFLEFDIKYIYIQGKRTNAQVLTILDVFSRWNLGQYIAYSIKADDVIVLFEKLFQEYNLPKCFIVRNDNGSQFEAAIVQQFLIAKGIKQEFTKPATPQQNAHIESYHSILESAVCQRFEFENLEDLKNTMNRWRDFYNFDRIHGGIGYKSPYRVLKNLGIDMKLNYKK